VNRVLRKSPLYCHPATPAPDIMLAHYFHVTPEGRLTVSYILRADPAILNLPDPVPNPQRRDGLWRTTCFEAFIRMEGEESYRELNFAPSGDWAAYRFTRYREGMAHEEVSEPPALVIEPYESTHVYRYTLAAPWLVDPRRWHVALTAVIEDRAGAISYWSMQHPAGPPDFHHADNYARMLGAPGEQL
jgi:hypothetical protein